VIQDAIEIQLSLDVYSLDSIKRAAYRLTDIAVFSIVVEGTNALVTIERGLDEDRTELKAIVQKFRNELLDADLRASIAKETENVRNTILSHVFSRTGLAEGE
jgi:His-Xaa-Ser system protein HxsD